MADTQPVYGPPDPQGPPPPKDSGPMVGEVRTVGQETRRWNGHGWELVPRTFLGSEDFTGRMKAYAKPVLGTMARDAYSVVRHPLDTIAGTANALWNPGPALQGVVDTTKAAAQGDPEAAGHVLAAMAGPRLADAALSGTNAVAHAAVNNPAMVKNLSSLAGMGAGWASGGGWPARAFGAAAGRYIGAPLVDGAAKVVANGTDWLKGAIHGDELPTVPPDLQEGYSGLARTYGKDVADNWLKKQTTNGPKSAAPGSGAPPSSSQPAARPPAPAPSGTDPLTGETPEQWKARVQSQLDAKKTPAPAAPPAGPKPVEPTAPADSTSAARQKAVEDTLIRLGKEHGRGTVAKIIDQHTPEVTNGALSRLDVRPSSLPEQPWQALKRDLLAGKSADPSRTLRTLQQLLKEHVRNGEQSTVPQRLSELLNGVTPEDK